MKRTLFLLVLLMSVAVLIAVVGCSDDDNGDGTITGNVNDPNFQGIVDVSDGAIDLHLDLIALNFELVGWIADKSAARSGDAPLAAADLYRDAHVESATHSYNASSGWHELNFAG